MVLIGLIERRECSVALHALECLVEIAGIDLGALKSAGMWRQHDAMRSRHHFNAHGHFIDGIGRQIVEQVRHLRDFRQPLVVHSPRNPAQRRSWRDNLSQVAQRRIKIARHAHVDGLALLDADVDRCRADGREVGFRGGADMLIRQGRQQLSS